MASNLTSKEPRQAMASWLKHFVKLAKSLPDSHRGLVNLYTTEQIAHLLFTMLLSLKHMQINQPFTTRTQEARKFIFTKKRRETKRDLQLKKQTKGKGREQENECEVDRNDKSNKLDFDHLYRPQQDDVRNLFNNSQNQCK
jgi:hypothetical protein